MEESKRFTVRIKQNTGTWRVVSYHKSFDAADQEACRLADKGWFPAIFEGNKKLAEMC